MKIQITLSRYLGSYFAEFLKELHEANRISRQPTEGEWSSVLTDRDIGRAQDAGLHKRTHGFDVISLTSKELQGMRQRIPTEKAQQEAGYIRRVLYSLRKLTDVLESRLSELENEAGTGFYRRRMAQIEASSRRARNKLEASG